MRLNEQQIRDTVAGMEVRDPKHAARMIELCLAGDEGMRFIVHAAFTKRGRFANAR